MRTKTLRYFLCVLLAMTAISRADEIFDKIQKINALLPCEELPLNSGRFREWVLGKQREMDLKDFEPSRILKVEGAYYIAEKGSTRWLVGNRAFEVKDPLPEIRCRQSFKDMDELQKAAAFAPLPKPPEGFTIREIARFPYMPTRLTSDGKGELIYALCGSGDIWQLDVKNNKQKQVLKSSEYIDLGRGDVMVVGMTLDPQNRLYIVVNQRTWQSYPVENEITVYRTPAIVEGDKVVPRVWLRAYYPWGIGPYSHCVGHIATGPDGMLYVSSGSRTDGGESGGDDRFGRGGEHELTSSIWRLDPKADSPKIEIFARGLRNPYGFCWDPKGRMFVTDNGPDAEPAEELNFVEQGKHYGFPYKFSDWEEKPYKTTPDAPAGQEFVLPIANLGPDAGFNATTGKAMFTFDPHSCPAGIVYLGDDFPELYRGQLLLSRFGNLIPLKKDVGFDILAVDLNKEGTPKEAKIKTFISPLSRPVDLHVSGKGKIYVCEYSRQTTNEGFAAMLPGRVLEIAVKAKP